MKKTFAEILNSGREESRKKLERKVPSWSSADICVPTSLNLEQCSSEATAAYKSSLVEGQVLADLTGGLGVDCWAFSRVMGRVLYNEIDPVTFNAARQNFESLGCSNIEASNLDAGTFLAGLGQVDWVYADPARRSTTGRKVFLLEDCTPDIIELKELIFSRTENLMVKLSPMIDLSLLVSRLGKELEQIHVTGTTDEVKEVLCILRKGHSGGDVLITATDFKYSLSFGMQAARDAKESYSMATVGEYLYEPGPVLMKSGGYRLCGLQKLAPNTNIYHAAEPHSFGKNHRIKDILDFNKSNMKTLAHTYPRCEITARNLPVGSDELRKKMGVLSGGDTHIFAVETIEGRKLFVCDVSQRDS